jgi:hypothetical protein
MRKFTSVESLLDLKRSYRQLFGSPVGELVLRDLAKLCHAASTTYDPDPREQARKEGKRQVWLRIQSMMHVSDAALINLTKDNPND